MRYELRTTPGKRPAGCLRQAGQYQTGRGRGRSVQWNCGVCGYTREQGTHPFGSKQVSAQPVAGTERAQSKPHYPSIRPGYAQGTQQVVGDALPVVGYGANCSLPGRRVLPHAIRQVLIAVRDHRRPVVQGMGKGIGRRHPLQTEPIQIHGPKDRGSHPQGIDAATDIAAKSGQGAFRRANPSTESFSRFEQGDINSGRTQGNGRRQSVGAGTNDSRGQILGLA